MEPRETASPREARGPSALQTLAEALRGTDRDLTTGPLGRAIFLLAVPMVLEMLMESIFAVVDVFFVGKLGAEAVAAVGITETILLFVYTAAVGLSIGATAIVARRVGEHSEEAAERSAAQVLLLGLAASVVFGIVGVVFAPELMRLMGAQEEVVAIGLPYARVMLGTNASIVLLFLVNAVFRGAGDAAVAMRVLWIANSVNIVLDPLLIFGIWFFPELGLAGAAVATALGRTIGFGLAAWRLSRPGGRLRVRARHFELDFGIVRRVVSLSATGTVQTFIGMASWIGLVAIITDFGAKAFAGYTIGIRIVLFALFPSWGLSNAAATLVGQSLGAGDPERAEAAVWKAGFYNMVFLGSVGAVFVAVPGPIVGLFSDDAEVLAYAADCLRIVALGFVFYAYGMVLTQSFNGAGDTMTPTILNLFIFWLWEIPLAYALAVGAGLGPRGAFLAITIAFSTLALASAALFRRGRWKTRTV